MSSSGYKETSSCPKYRDQATTQRYAHLSDDPLRAAADRTSGRIAAAMGGQQEAEIVDLRK